MAKRSSSLKAEYDNITHQQEAGLDLRSRTVYLFEDIEFSEAKKLILSLDLLESRSSQPIVIKMSSYGGDIYASQAMYDRIQQCASHVTIIGTGPIMSAATFVFQAADMRLLTPNARMMIHQSRRYFMGGDKLLQHELQSIVKDDEALDGIYYDVLSKRSNLNIEELRAMCLKETYMSANQVVAYGLADGIYRGPN